MSVITYGAISVPVLADFKPADAHTIINHSDSVMLLVDSQTMTDLSEKEMKHVKHILSLDDFGILSEKPAAAFKKAHEGLDAMFEKKYPQGFNKDHIRLLTLTLI